MEATLFRFACSQCGTDAPEDETMLSTWRYGHMALNGEFPEVIDSLLLCPGCVADDFARDFDAGAGD